jgi:hypothetical protein
MIPGVRNLNQNLILAGERHITVDVPGGNGFVAIALQPDDIRGSKALKLEAELMLTHVSITLKEAAFGRENRPLFVH